MDPKLLLMQYVPLLIATTTSLVLTHLLIFKRTKEAMGLGLRRFFKDYAWGWILGFVMVFVGFLILRLTGLLDIIGYDFDYLLIGGFFVFFLVQSLFEEIAFRSYLMPAISDRFGIWAALIISSLVFALVHIANSNVSPMGMLNIFSAGILLGILFIRYGNVWAASGLHFSWNYIQSTILGFEVSGEQTFNMMDTEEVGPDLITGGAFGFEGSIIAFLFLLLLIFYYFIKDSTLRSKLHLDKSSDLMV